MLTEYSERERAASDRAREEAGRSLALSRARLVVFAAAAVVLIALLRTEGPIRTWLLYGLLLLAIVFGFLVARHTRIDERRRWFETLARVNRDQGARMRRDWRAVPHAAVAPAPPHHSYADDLDVLGVGPGHASLIDLIGPLNTTRGREFLRDWLLSPAPPALVSKRQAAARELAPLVDFREQFAARAILAAAGSRRASLDPAVAFRQFLQWAEGPPWLISRPWLLWLARLLGGSTALLVIAQALGIVDDPVWLVPLLPAVVLWFIVSSRIERTFQHAFARNDAPREEARLFELIASRPFSSDLAAGISRALSSEAGAGRAMLRLQRLMELADIRLTPLFHFPLNAVTMWDFHVVAAVERWQVTCGRRVREWFERTGELEALAAVATLVHDNPGWAFPEIDTSATTVTARALAHPFLPEQARVANDVEVGPPGTFLFVTGSNMSGKSTLLRAIGINAVLAQAGAPVCATAMTLMPVRVETSMRVQDSLEEGVSYFMAGLKRLKEILSEAAASVLRRSPTDESGTSEDREVLLYLLDEILQGTNTAERQIAVRTVVRRLISTRSLGAITSHDLNLIDESDLRSAAHAVHFSERVDVDAASALSFDYTLRPGVATSRNALKLMRLMGLD